MKILGGCHCGNLEFVLHWPQSDTAIPVRACTCSFCTMRGGVHTSHPEARLEAFVRDEAEVSKYRFGTRTADFYICRICGGEPFVTSEIDGRLYAVVNVNTFADQENLELDRSAGEFDAESTNDRLARRASTWIPEVSLTMRGSSDGSGKA